MIRFQQDFPVEETFNSSASCLHHGKPRTLAHLFVDVGDRFAEFAEIMNTEDGKWYGPDAYYPSRVVEHTDPKTWFILDPSVAKSPVNAIRL